MMEDHTPQDIKKINLKDTKSANLSLPKTAPAQMSGKERAGVNLTWGVLALVGGFLLAILALVSFGTPSPENLEFLFNVSDGETMTDAVREQYVATYQAEKEARREFIIALLDKVLINVLLPVLTALLGYIFGTSVAGGKPDSDA